MMRYLVRTLLIVLALASVNSGCGPAPRPIAVAVAPLPLPELTAPVAESAVPVEWSELSFVVHDRATFRVDQLSDRIRQLEGKLVTVRGYFHMATTGPEVRKFLLLGEINTPRTGLKFGASPYELPIHQIAAVELVTGQTAKVTEQPIAVTGRLRFEIVKFNDQASLVFQINAATVEPVLPRAGYHRALEWGC